jgi:hypothetical protein
VIAISSYTSPMAMGQLQTGSTAADLSQNHGPIDGRSRKVVSVIGSALAGESRGERSGRVLAGGGKIGWVRSCGEGRHGIRPLTV